MIHDSVISCIGNTPLVRLSRCFPRANVEVLAKLEMLNPAGSMKDRPARFIIEQGIAEGELRPGMRLVESTSGNLGMALAMASRLFGLEFTAVVDPNTTSANLKLLRSFGAAVDMVTEADEGGGYLHSRVRRAKQLAEGDPGAVWVNQYANERNPRAYFETVGAEIARAVEGPIDHLVTPVSTTGSVQGLARRLRQNHPQLRVTAVDAAGSVIFGAKPHNRRLPGFGASRVPELFRPEEIDDVIHVDDVTAALGCRRLVSAEGILAGGSSGAVVAAIERLIHRVAEPARIVCLLPDRGERYLDLVYDDTWLNRLLDEQTTSTASGIP
jgi:N-(2-amino-2-carboxyethyl)-L-glutamate synthase